MREFTYRGIARLGVVFLQATGAIAILLVTLGAGWLVAAAIRFRAPQYDTVGCLVLWMLLIGWTVGLAQINVFPTVWVDNYGLTISAFFYKRVAIPWSDVIDVGAGRVPFGHTLIRARRITPFHRIYGWLYSLSLHPGFLIRRDIENCDELLYEIKRRSHRLHTL